MLNNFTKSIRIPDELNTFMYQFAKRYNVSTSYVYRLAVTEFIQAQNNKQKI
jgi:predicted transcriptional regulator